MSTIACVRPTPALAIQKVNDVETIESDRRFHVSLLPGLNWHLARRLSNAEYDYTIRDLTGIDIRPAREFPVDPANQAGFDNTGESLTMSPALLKKYLAAARHVADHVVFKPEGFVFAPHPIVTETDRDKYCVQRIIDFYQRHPIDYADYFLAAWKYRLYGGDAGADVKKLSDELKGDVGLAKFFTFEPAD